MVFDKKAREEVEKLNAADALIFSTEKQLKEYGEKISADKKTSIEDGLKKLKEAHAAKDFAAIDIAQTELQSAWNVASEEMYKATQETPGADGSQAQTDGAAPSGETDDSVTDVDFEEVKEDDKK